jgi:hypothetical protein
MNKQSSISVSPETLATWQELSARTRIPIARLLKEITANVQKQLDLLDPDRTLNFFTDLYIDSHTPNLPKTLIIIRLSDATSFGLDFLPVELQEQVMKAFGYERQPDGTLKDTTERDDKKEVLIDAEREMECDSGKAIMEGKKKEEDKP